MFIWICKSNQCRSVFKIIIKFEYCAFKNEKVEFFKYFPWKMQAILCVFTVKVPYDLHTCMFYLWFVEEPGADLNSQRPHYERLLTLHVPYTHPGHPLDFPRSILVDTCVICCGQAVTFPANTILSSGNYYEHVPTALVVTLFVQ